MKKKTPKDFEETIELEPNPSKEDSGSLEPKNLWAERQKMQFKIRPYSDSDFERFFELHREMVRNEFDPHELLDRAEFGERLLETLERYDFPFGENMIFVAETENKEYGGHVWFSQKTQTFNGRPESRVYDVSVAPRFRNMGLGEALMIKAEEFSRDLGIPQMTLHLFTPNPVVRKIFDSRGYRITSLKFSKPL